MAWACSPRWRSTASRTISGALWTRPTASASPSSWMWSTTTSAPTATTSSSIPATISPIATPTNGARPSISMARIPRPVREWVVTNAAYWAVEYHLDGLRLDATQQIFDASAENIMTALANRMRAAAHPRQVVIVAENEAQQTRTGAARRAAAATASTRLWNDDFHQVARVAVTGHNDAYYSDYRGRAQEFISTVKYGYLFQGQRYTWQAKRRGSPAWGLDPWQFVTYIQNHDQIANSGNGERLHQLTSPGRYRAITALLLLAPRTPDAFPGSGICGLEPVHLLRRSQRRRARRPSQAKAASSSWRNSRTWPNPRCGRTIRIPPTRSPSNAAKLDFAERQTHIGAYRLHRDLLKLRREDGVIPAQRAHGVDGAVLGEEALLLRFFGQDGNDRLLLVNLGLDLRLDPAPEPLLAPPEECVWELLWSSEDPAYGGTGTAARRQPRRVAHSRTCRGGVAPGPSKGEMADLIRVLPRRDLRNPEVDRHLTEEWLVTNGLGGYASGTVSGAITRRYHGLLMAALPNPAGPHDDAQRALRTAAPSRSQRGLHRRRRAGRHHSRAHPPGGPSSAWRPASPSGATKSMASCSKSACSCPTARTRYISPITCSPVRQTAPRPAALHSFPIARRPGERRRPSKYVLTVSEDQFEITLAGRVAASCACG